MACTDCNETNVPEVDNSSIECCELTPTNCVVTSEAIPCLQVGKGSTLTNLFKRLCIKLNSTPTSFLQLTDTPSSYEGQEGKVATVGPDGGIIFSDSCCWEGGTNYIFVKAQGTPLENGQELADAYTFAKTQSATATNRFTVLLSPGYYDLQSDLILDEEYIDITSLSEEDNIHTFSSDIYITVDNITLKGITLDTGVLYVSDSLPNIKVENCSGGNGFATGSNILEGSFLNCKGGDNSFTASVVSGVFERCEAGDVSFGPIASGIFIKCKGGAASFGVSVADGHFKDCESLSDSYGRNNICSGFFEGCKGGDSCFGLNADISGTFIRCEGEASAFKGSNITNAIVESCIGGSSSFQLSQVGGTIIDSYYIRCRLTSGTYGIPGATKVLCVDGNYNII